MSINSEPCDMFLAVHVGAGHHAHAKTDEYTKLCVRACQEARSSIRLEDSSVVDVVTKAVAILEDSPLTNAGIGSSLTEDGKIECDASIVEGTSHYFGAVGAVSGIQNPVKLAERLMWHQRISKLPHGRIPPAFLVGDGAKNWAFTNGFVCASDTDMMTKSVVKMYQEYKTRLEKPPVSKKRRLEEICNYSGVEVGGNILGPSDPEAELAETISMEVTDTVGAIAVDTLGRTASAVSSGGLMMKQSGRVGPASVIGSGCWAEDCSGERFKSVAVSTTGCGETLMRTMFARECATALCDSDDTCPTTSLQKVFTKSILNPQRFTRQPERLAGALALVYDPNDKHGEVFWAHTTDSMCLAFVSSNARKAKGRMSRLHEGASAGQLVVVEGSSFTLS